jgi:hypothetical protein
MMGWIGISLFLTRGIALGQALGSPCDGDTILLANGTYDLTNTLYIVNVNNVTIRGLSGCQDVVLVGRRMDNANYGNVPHGVWSNALHTVVAHLTIRDVYAHPIIFNAGAQAPHVYNVKLLNAGKQFIKANPNGATSGVDYGLVEYSVIEYTAGPPATAHGVGVGYTNGMSIHTANNWIIRGNLFKNFHTPDSSAYLWNPAVLVWNHSTNTLTERNTFVNVDRAVAYGLQANMGSDHQGGIIRNNFIFMQPDLLSPSRKADSDAQILVWDSPGTQVFHNTILTNGNVVNAIEARFNTMGAEIRNNLTDAPLGSRDGGSYSESGNLLTATAGMFVNATVGALHLQATATAVIDQAPALTSVLDDIDGDLRPSGVAYGIGADEFSASGAPLIPPTYPRAISTSATP